MERKEIVQRVGEHFGVKPKYMEVPSFAYQIEAAEETYTVDREGKITTSDGKEIEFEKLLGLEIVFHNTTDRNDYSYGAWYRLEVHSKGQWLTVNPLPDAGWDQDDWDRRMHTQEWLEQESLNSSLKVE